MIRFSAALVAVAIGVLIGGIATSKLLLVYIAIVVSAVALAALVIGVVLRREELFGEGQGLVPAAAGAGPVPPVHAGDSQGKVPSSGYVAPQPPAAGAAAGYGVPFGGVAQATASPGPGLAATPQGAARPGRTAEPVPPWETAATREAWTPDWMPAGKDQRAASGAGVRAPSAWQDTAPPAPAGGWGAPAADAPNAGAPRAGAPHSGATDAGARHADGRAATVPPWPAPPTMPTPVPSDAPAAKPDAGSEATTPNWFDRLGKPADGGAPTAPTAPAPGSAWSWSSQDAGPPGAPVAQEEPATVAAAVGPADGDEDDDWPTRYSWLDDETGQAGQSVKTGQAGESVKTGQAGKDGKRGKAVSEPEATAAGTAPAASASAKPRDAETAARKSPDLATSDQATPDQAIPDEEPADEETRDAAAHEPADAAGETGATVIAFRSRKVPEPEEPDPASDADEEAGPAVAKPEADLGTESEPGAETSTEPGDQPEDKPADGAALVAVVRGVPRYHEPDCVLIRFMPEGDLLKLTVPQAKEDGCTPCGACQPTG